MKIKNFWLLQDKKEKFEISFKKPLVSLMVAIGLIILFYVGLIVFSKTPTLIPPYSFLGDTGQKQLPVVKGIVATQIPSAPGEPISWQMIVPASAILAGQHLVEIPKSAEQIKITLIDNTKTLTKKIATNKIVKKKIQDKTISASSTNLTRQDRLKLSELSKQTARSSESLALAQTLDKQNKDNVNEVLSQGYSSGFFTKVWNLLADVGSRMTASAEAAVQDIIIPPQPETVMVDIAPQLETAKQDVVLSETQSMATSTESDISPLLDTSSSTTSNNTGSISTDSVGVESAGTNTTTTAITTTTSTSTNTEPPLSSTDTSNKNSNIVTTSATTTTVLTKNTDVLVEYKTPAPVIAEVPTETGKIVAVSDDAGNAEGQPHTTNVLVFTNIPEIYKVGQGNKIKIKWLNNNNQDIQFHAYDLDGNGKLDYVEWTVPHLSTQTFEIIFITKALEMDENGEIVTDIYDQVKNQDNTWATIPSGHTIRVTFEKFLTNKNDNTIYAKPTRVVMSTTSEASEKSQNPVSSKIDVYPVYDGVTSEYPVVVFENIDTEKTYKVLLTGLPHSTNTFDLKITGSVDIDYIVDPTPVVVTDTFHNTTKIASLNGVVIDTTNGLITLAASSSWVCGSALIDARDGKTYTTVLIGSQCWMQQNLNVGTMVLGSATQGTSSVSIQKYCYGDVASGCTSNGGLYQWDQTMAGTTTVGARGICPAGWHVPTHNEFTTLERSTCTSGTCVTDFPYDTSTTGWRGTNEGTTMKNTSGSFRGILTGYRYADGTFSGGGTNAYFWSSVASGGSAWIRYLTSGSTGVGRNTNPRTYGFSVRCLKD